jgi:mono/diheme cytochrome c family protein
MKRRLSLACLVALPLAGLVLVRPGAEPLTWADPPQGKVEYARDIQPILSGNCFVCHGPDEKMRKAGLRLDQRAAALKELRSGSRAIVPGDSKNSELIARVFSTDDDRMPPPKGHAPLKDAQKQLLKRWIDEGADYQPHWAFVVPKHPALPQVKTPGWARNAVDYFVLARLEKEGLAPMPEADRYALARRVALDLTGLPPSVAEVERFVNDPSPDAYEQYVDRVLASPAYGERWALMWLDLARYADTNGYANDNARTIWKYRDWVVDAFNHNMPFDRFTIEQLAGDLLPKPTTDQLIATAFQRNTLINDEGGTDDEEFRVAAVVDRVNTTLLVWMGLTMNCAQCHDHKYDPIKQEEFYRVYAIYNQTEDGGKSPNPVLQVATPEQLAQKATLEAKAAALDRMVNGPSFALDVLERQWEKDTKPDKLPANVKPIFQLDPAKRTAAQQAQLTKYFRSVAPELKGLRDQAAAAQKAVAGLKITTTPIMKELPEAKKRITKVHHRGNFLDQGKVVTPGVPAQFHPLPADEPANRLALAKWLLDPQNPLTARVTVNRFWEQVFGVGLVETPEDWGIRSKPPTHPELLDWLATEFVATKWDVKQLLRLLVTSATYRQSAKVTAELYQRDPDNRLFARGPRFRLSAEAIRDQALAVSGLLSPKLHGPPVRPPRPKMKLNAAFGGATDWEDSVGDDKYRRGLYTFWQRTTPYPSMTTFDAPNRYVCTVNRPRTNTPLQALVTLNDPAFVEAAQALARRTMKEGGATVEEKVRFAFRQCLARPPRDLEVKRLVELYQHAREQYAGDSKEALVMATQPLGPLPAGVEPAEAAAWTVVGNVLLNLDEMFLKR